MINHKRHFCYTNNSVVYNISDHICCELFSSDKNYMLTTTDIPGRSMLPRGLISDKYSEVSCIREHMKCIDINAWV